MLAAENIDEISYVFRLFGAENFGDWPTNEIATEVNIT